MSLAYVFWHQARQGVDAEEYERTLSAFHESLAADRPVGFRTAVAFRHLSLPWAAADAVVYEDWYVVEDFAALGALNETAVTGARRASHDAAARTSEWGAGGMYGLVNGEPSVSVNFAYYLSKPKGWTYDRILGVLNAAPFTAIWQRQMVLGPAPEFCIHSNEQLDLALPNILATSPALVWPK